MDALIATVGFLLLVGGNYASWLFVGGSAFVFANQLARAILDASSLEEWIFLTVGSGIIAILLNRIFKIPTIALATFFTGGYLSYYLPKSFGWDTSWHNWFIYMIAGVITVVIFLIWRTIPLILISSLLGATLIVQNIKIGDIHPVSMFIVLWIFGLITQLVMMQYITPDTES